MGRALHRIPVTNAAGPAPFRFLTGAESEYALRFLPPPPLPYAAVGIISQVAKFSLGLVFFSFSSPKIDLADGAHDPIAVCGFLRLYTPSRNDIGLRLHEDWAPRRTPLRESPPLLLL
jgi:hypothetical protein